MKAISNLNLTVLIFIKLLFIYTLFMTPLLKAETEKKSSTLTGSINVTPKITEKYTLFIILSKTNQQSIEAQKNPPSSSDPSQNETPTSYIFNLGLFNKTTPLYSISAPQESWFLTALLKKKSDECPSYTLNGQSKIKSCYPGKDDVVCESYSLEIKDSKMSGPLIECNKKL